MSDVTMVERVANALREGGSYEDMARAAIEALMEPSQQMLLACWPNHHPWGEHAPRPEDRPEPVAIMSLLVLKDWQAMLRTALSQPNTEGK